MTYAAAILLLLRREWYRQWVRRAFPIADGTLLVIGLGVSQLGADTLDKPAGLATTFAALCIVLAFSGAFRLTRSAVEVTTGLAVLVLLFTAALGWLPLPAASGAAVAALFAGVLAFYVTQMIRRVVMNEVTRVMLNKAL